MKKYFISFLLFISALPAFSLSEDSCPYTFDGFVSQVRDYCGNPGNIDFCVDLARNCGEISKNGKPAFLNFMGKVHPQVLEAMFNAGLETPFKYDRFPEDIKEMQTGLFICDMVADHAKGNLPLQNFKVIWRAAGFEPDDLYRSVCSIKKLEMDFRPHELAALLDLRQLTSFFTSLRAPMSEDLNFGIPLDIWAAAYYPTGIAEDFLYYLKNPANIIYIDENTDFSLFMPKGTQVLLLGEAHHAGYYKTAKEIIKSLKCKPGLTHFASEFLMEMQSEDIEEFRRTGDVCKIKLPSSVLMTRDGTKVLQGLNNTNMACLSAAGCDVEYLPLEKTSRMLGYEEDDGKTAKKEFMGLFKNGPRSKKQKEAHLLKLIGFRERTVTVSGVEGRNYEWADPISSVLENNPSAKIFAYMGKGHSSGLFSTREEGALSVTEILKKRGFKVKTVSLAGASYDLFPDSFIFRSAGLHKKHFIFKIPDEFKRYFNADFIVHIPSAGTQEKILKNWLSSYKPKYYRIKK
ncbi:MAG: hypothetical protein PUB86_05155 [Elusimicrobia bacterium]|nr:hypothetical protein [Elusimicrobiota bacterium]